MYFCTGQASKLARCLQLLLKLRRPRVSQAALVCQYLYFFTSKASKLSTCSRRLAHAAACSSFNAFNSWQAHERQYLYCCTNKASNLLAQACACRRMLQPHGIQLLALTSAYVSIRQHTSAYAGLRTPPHARVSAHSATGTGALAGALASVFVLLY